MARAWVDPAYRGRLLSDGAAAIAGLGYGGDEGSTMVVLPNGPGVHNAVVCTLCSCYPWPVLGLPPSRYKSAPYRARMVSEPRTVLREFGLVAGPDASGPGLQREVGDLVLQRRRRYRGWEEALAAIVTRSDDRRRAAVADRCRGGRRPRRCRRRPGVDGAAARANGELVFEEVWQGRALGLGVVVLERTGAPWSEFREHLVAAITAHVPVPGESPATAYYAAWLDAVGRCSLLAAWSRPTGIAQHGLAGHSVGNDRRRVVANSRPVTAFGLSNKRMRYPRFATVEICLLKRVHGELAQRRSICKSAAIYVLLIRPVT